MFIRNSTPKTLSRGSRRCQTGYRVFRCGLTALILLFSAASARAQGVEDLGREKARLEDITNKIKQSEARRDKLQAAADRLKGDARRLQRQLVAAAARIQAKEADVDQLERELKGLSEVEVQKVAMLERRGAELMNTLAALQRLSRQPQSAFFTRPETAINAVRSASLLSNVVPSLRAEAIDLGEEIAALNQLRDEIFNDRQQLARALGLLDGEREKLDRLVRKKRDEQSRFAKNANVQADHAKSLAAKANSIRDLIGRLDAARQETSKTKRGNSPAWSSQGQPFSTTKGALVLPVHGRVSRSFGQPDDAGTPLNGIYIETIEQARITAPYDGQIVYAGPFRDYGQLLIIAHGEGYHTLLAGMSQIDGVVGQWVLSGEPIGQMGSYDTNEKPNLYVELRRHGAPINPLPWLAANKRKVRG